MDAELMTYEVWINIPFHEWKYEELQIYKLHCIANTQQDLARAEIIIITKSPSKSTRPCEKVTSIRLDFGLLCTKNLISIVWVTWDEMGEIVSQRSKSPEGWWQVGCLANSANILLFDASWPLCDQLFSGEHCHVTMWTRTKGQEVLRMHNIS